MTGVGGGLTRRIGVSVCATFLALALGPAAAQAEPMAGPCVRLTVTPPQPALGERVTVYFRLVGPLAGSGTEGTSGERTAVVLRGSITGPGRHTLPLSIERSNGDLRLFRSRFRPNFVGAWHTRVLVFGDRKEANDQGNPLCYVSKRFVVVRSHPAPVVTTPDRGGPADIVLPVVAVIPIVLGLGLLVMSGRRRARREGGRPEPAAVSERDAPTEPAGR